MSELVENIEVSESSDNGNKRRLEISIEYRFIGALLQNGEEDMA